MKVGPNTVLAITVLALALLGAACGATDDVTGALSMRPSASPVVSPTVAPTSQPTDASDGEKPPIVVRTPLPDDEVVAPVTIAGTANVFEATVSIRVLDESGRELASTFTTATCGSGCRGRFSTEVFFFTDRRQDGTIELFESSAEDGSELHLVSIPVVLVP